MFWPANQAKKSHAAIKLDARIALESERGSDLKEEGNWQQELPGLRVMRMLGKEEL